MRAHNVAPAVRTTLKVTSTQTFVRIRIVSPQRLHELKKKPPEGTFRGPLCQEAKRASPLDQPSKGNYFAAGAGAASPSFFSSPSFFAFLDFLAFLPSAGAAAGASAAGASAAMATVATDGMAKARPRMMTRVSFIEISLMGEL